MRAINVEIIYSVVKCLWFITWSQCILNEFTTNAPNVVLRLIEIQTCCIAKKGKKKFFFRCTLSLKVVWPQKHVLIKQAAGVQGGGWVHWQLVTSVVIVRPQMRPWAVAHNP